MIKHVQGNIFDSNADAILHQVNCQGVMGAGVAKQVREKYPFVYNLYKQLCNKDKIFKDHLGFSHSNLLGYAQVCPINHEEDKLINLENKHYIVNLFAQDDCGSDKCYTDYKALKKCLEYVNKRFAGKSVAIPYLMSCGLAGGDWSIVSKIIEETLTDCDVTLYEYKGE